jgi:hypothetical protein
MASTLRLGSAAMVKTRSTKTNSVCRHLDRIVIAATVSVVNGARTCISP